MNDFEIAEKFSAQRIHFFSTLLDLLPFHHWNERLLNEAAEKCNFERGYHHLLFPGGLREIISAVNTWQDQLLIENLEKMHIKGNTKEKIAHAIYERLVLNSKINHIKFMSYFVTTVNPILANHLAWQTCSKIWYYAGDKSVDFNYYTKRSLLLGAYSSAIIFYASDESLENTATKKFINDALNFITEYAKFKNKFSLPKIHDIPFLRLL